MKILFSSICAAFALLTSLTGCDEELFSKSARQIEAFTSPAKGEVSSLTGHEDVALANHEPDYAIKVSFSVKNKGKAGLIKIMPWLSCSEGEWTRTQNLNFAEGETEELSYLFSELSINATNIRFGVNVLPAAE